jgi:hypothetical protein
MEGGRCLLCVGVGSLIARNKSISSQIGKPRSM